MNPTAPRICSGVPDCPSGLWVPGSSGLRVWSCPPALLEAYQRLASQSSGDLRPRAAVGAGQREPLDTGGVVLCRTARAAGVSAVLLAPCARTARAPPLPGLHTSTFASFSFPIPSRSSLPSPHQADGEVGVRGERRVAPGFPPFALRLPLPCPPDSTQVLPCHPCPPSFSHSPTMIYGTNPIFKGVGLPRVSLLRSKTDKYLKGKKKSIASPPGAASCAPRPRSSRLQAERPRGSAEPWAG